MFNVSNISSPKLKLPKAISLPRPETSFLAALEASQNSPALEA